MFSFIPPCKRALQNIGALLFCSSLFGASIFIDCGSSADQYFTGGTAYTVQPATDTTLRFSSLPFSYKIPVDPDGPYIVTLRFLEPSSAPPARAFAVTINDQLMLPRVTMPGYLVPFSRSVIVYSSDGFITIRFDTLTRSAVVSSIEVAPLVLTQYIVPSDPKTVRVTEAVPVWMNDGYYVPRPASVPDSTILLLYTDVGVYLNGLRMRAENQMADGADYLIPQRVGQLRIVPANGQPWPSISTVTVDYTAVFPAQ